MTIPANCISLEEAARRINVAPHVILFWQRRCGGFKVLAGRNGEYAVRSTDVSLLLAIHRLVAQDGHTLHQVAEKIEQRGVSSIIMANDRKLSRLLAEQAKDAETIDDFATESALLARQQQVSAIKTPFVAPEAAPSDEQQMMLQQLADAASSVQQLHQELRAIDKILEPSD